MVSKTLKRSAKARTPICHWCREDIDPDTPYRTDFEAMEPVGSVGWFVCSPACPSRPDDSRCWERRRGWSI